MTKKIATFKPRGILASPDAEVRMDRLVRAIKDGLYLDDACKLAGISKATFYQWVKKSYEGIEPYHNLMVRVDEASAQAIEERNEIIRQAAKAGDWKAAAWWMERVHKDKYAADTKVVVEAKVSEQVDSLLQEVQAMLPEQDYARLIARLSQDPSEKEDLVGEEIQKATDVSDAVVEEDEVNDNTDVED